MASLDVRDVLNLPQDGGSGAGRPRPAKKQKTAAHHAAGGNLKGLAREVQSLGGESSIAVVPRMLSNLKKRRLASRKPAARWEMRPFQNSARDDGGKLVLRHWRRQQPQAQQPPPTTDATNDTGAAPGTAAAPAPAPAPAAESVDAQQGAAEGAAAEPSADDMKVDGPETAPEQPQQQPQTTQAVGKPLEDSAFAKYNVKVVVPQYSDDQYNANLQHPDWSKEETDYLLQLVKDFDLRWPLIWDRYDYRPPGEDASSADASTAEGSSSTALVPASQANGSSGSRSMEDLKARYYEIAAKMMAVQKPAQYMTQAEYTLHGTMANFNPEKEKLRKAFVANALTRSREEVREEEALLLEVRRIMARVDRTNEERRELYSRLDFPHADQDISSFKTSQGLQNLLSSLMFNSSERAKKRKSLGGPEGSGAALPSPALASGSGAQGAAAAEAGGGSRRDSIAASGAGGGGQSRRESLGPAGDKAAGAAAPSSDAAAPAATPTSATPTSALGGGKNSKKGAAQAERRKLTPQEQDVYGVSYHDRLGSGPTFRYEKINKLFTHKSGQQQLRITNILSELDMPARLFMPTAAVVQQFETLVNAVVQLVDLRKVSDKLDGEIKIEEQRKAERDKAKAVLSGSSGSGQLDGAAESSKTKEEAAKKTASAGAPAADAAAAATATGDAKADGAAGGEASSADKDDGEKDAKEGDAKAAAAAADAAEGPAKTAEEEQEQKPTITNGEDTTTTTIPTKEADGSGEKDKDKLAVAGPAAGTSSRPGSSSSSRSHPAGGPAATAHKRSASVLSAASDKSAKRQKK